MALVLLQVLSLVVEVVAEFGAELGLSSVERPGSSEQERARNPQRSVRRDLGAALGFSPGQAAQQRRLAIQLTAVLLDVARADGTLDPAETEEALRSVWNRLDLPPEDRQAVEALFRDALVQAPRAETAARELGAALSERQRAAVTEGLYRVAAADGEVHRAERARLRRLCELLQVPEATRRTAVSRALGSVALCYELLDVSPDVTDLQLKEAYLRRSMEVTGELEQGQVDAAYQELRIMRGMD